MDFRYCRVRCDATTNCDHVLTRIEILTAIQLQRVTMLAPVGRKDQQNREEELSQDLVYM